MKWLAALLLLAIAFLSFELATAHGDDGPIVIPWTKVGSTKADFDRDGKDCFEFATTTEQFPEMQQLAFGVCMKSKGWTQEK